MAKESANGDQHTLTRPPPTPSPLRFSKFFQANMRILVSGGAGFIGSHLVDRLMENEKNEVIVVDNYFTGSKDNLRKWIGHPRFELIRHDITEPLLVEVDQIYHLACPASPIFYKYNPVKTIKTNVIGTLNMLGLAKRVGARILLTSTSEVYGDPLQHPQTEEYWGNVNPIDIKSRNMVKVKREGQGRSLKCGVGPCRSTVLSFLLGRRSRNPGEWQIREKSEITIHWGTKHYLSSISIRRLLISFE